MFLIYGGDKVLVVDGYVDASFDTDLDASKSQTGYVFILNGGAVSWCSSKKSVVAGSTCEAEYIAASEATNEGVWMKEFICDLGGSNFSLFKGNLAPAGASKPISLDVEEWWTILLYIFNNLT